MANESLRIDIASEFVGAKAFNQADTATAALSKQVNKLAKQYLGLYGAQKLARASVNAVKAFAADDKAARILSKSLDNLGLAFADPAVRSFIHSLEQTYGVMDDLLRPAFQKLLTTTGSVQQAQKLLTTALDLSAASGKDVVTVAGDLSKGYVGQTRALAKYGLGLTQAQLKAMSFEQIQSKINELFSGQAALSADTYSGKIDKLTVAAKNAQETIGKGLVEAIGKLGGGGTDGLDNAINKMDKLAKLTSAVVNTFADVFQAISNPVGFYKQNAAAKPNYMGTIPSITTEVRKAAAEKAAAKARATMLKTTIAQTKAIKEQTALQKAGTLFDIEQAGIIAALKGKITDEERKRLELQLAILTGNTSEASKLAGELAKSQGLSAQLAAYLANLPDAKNPFTGWKSYLDMLEAQVRMIAGIQPGAPATNVPAAMGNPQGIYPLESGSQGNFTYGQNNAPDVSVIVTLDGQEITGAVSKVQTNNYLSGKIIALERLQSQFG
jgi:hypothetical protein